MLVRQLEEEVVKTRQHAKETNPEIKAHIEGLQLENDHLTREVAILKETIKVSPPQISSVAQKKYYYLVYLLIMMKLLRDFHFRKKIECVFHTCGKTELNCTIL